MSKLTKAQSKTGKLQILEKEKENDKAEEHGLRVDRPADIVKKRRKVFKRENLVTKGRKRPDGNRGK